jgi:outer membrane protein OmpA-like peptidoglycan-associated protein
MTDNVPICRWFVVLTLMSQSVVTPASSQSKPVLKIPMIAGLTTVSAVEGPRGDYESTKKIERVDSEGVHMVYLPARGKPVYRTVLPVDQERSRHYLLRFAQNYPRIVPNTTGLGASKLVLTDLKKRGHAGFRCCMLRSIDREELGGTLRRVGTGTVPIDVMVNNQRVSLPTIHARGRLGRQESEFHFLDDVDNPIALRWEVGRQKLQVIKISFPDKATPARIEAELAKSGRAEIYGIYFDFASAVITPESEPVLKEIAGVMSKNPGWKLKVEGHTDNIGGNAENLDLSRRRAAAVKEALVTKHGIAGSRLTTDGYGASRPKETNETLEGRARNRRVELAKQ